MSFRITREVLDHAPAGLTPGARMVLTVLADIADDTRVCWPGRQTLVHRSDYTARTVRRALAELEKAGLITRGPGWRGHRAEYRISRIAERGTWASPSGDGKGGHPRPERGTSATGKGDTQVPPVGQGKIKERSGRAPRARGTAARAARSWCGTCDQDTRLTETSDGKVQRCPHCHPLTAPAHRRRRDDDPWLTGITMPAWPAP